MRYLSLSTALWLTSSAAPALTARVEPTPAGPRLLIDGVPTVPRMFYGSPRPGTTPATADWQTTTYTFLPSADAPGNGTLHFRFGRHPGTIRLRNLTVTEVATGRAVLPADSLATADAFARDWAAFPRDARNTVAQVAVEDGGVVVTLTAPPDGQWPDFHLHTGHSLTLHEGQDYRVSVEVQATPDRPLQSTFYAVTDGYWAPVGGPSGPFGEQVALAAAAGVRIVSVPLPSAWLPPDQPDDWAAIDASLRNVLAASPDALLLPRVGLNAPGWWLERHPESRMLYDNGRRGPMATVSDREYRAAAADYLERLCRHLTEAWPDQFLGIHPCGQNTGEWFYEASWSTPLSGYAEPTQAAWRAWLEARGEPATDVPGAAARRAHPHGLLRDPVAERQVVAFEQFRQEEMADFVLALAAAARRGTGGTRLVAFFYGYGFEFAGLPNNAPISGHYALRRVLDSPDIDILCAPYSYYDREWQGTGTAMSPAESVALAGKLWLNEDDTRTFLSTQHAYGQVDDLNQSQHVLLRNTAQAALRGFGTWWMDLMGEGWYHDARLWEIQQQLWPTERALLARSQPFIPEVALVLDERSMLSLAGQSRPLARPLVYESRAHVGRSGAPYGQYLLDDVVAGKVPAKLQIHIATFAPTAAERAALKAQTGVSRIWCYASGWLTPTGGDLAAMADLTGFRCQPATPTTGRVTPTAAGRALGLLEPWGAETPIAPLFAVEPGQGEVLATWDDGTAAVVLRDTPAGGDLFCAVPALTPALVRAMARRAGVHVFADDNASVWADGDFVSVTPMQTGPLTITGQRPGIVHDALRNAPLGEGQRITLPAIAGETRLLRWE